MIEQELLGYQIGFVILYCSFLYLMFIVFTEMRMGNILRKNKILETKKGTYTFTPKGEVPK